MLLRPNKGTYTLLGRPWNGSNQIAWLKQLAVDGIPLSLDCSVHVNAFNEFSLALFLSIRSANVLLLPEATTFCSGIGFLPVTAL